MRVPNVLDEISAKIILSLCVPPLAWSESQRRTCSRVIALLTTSYHAVYCFSPRRDPMVPLLPGCWLIYLLLFECLRKAFFVKTNLLEILLRLGYSVPFQTKRPSNTLAKVGFDKISGTFLALHLIRPRHTEQLSDAVHR